MFRQINKNYLSQILFYSTGMNRRSVLRTVATAGAIATGATAVASAGGDDELYLVTREGGEQVVRPLSEVDRDVEVQDHCHTYCCEDCPNTDCGDDCVCEAYCYV